MRLSDKTETYEALNQHIVFDTKTKPIDWFLYDRNHRHERVEQPLLLGEKQPKKRCSQNFLKIHRKTTAPKSFLIKLQAKRLRPATLLKKRLWDRCFPVNFAKFLRTPFFTENIQMPASGWSYTVFFVIFFYQQILSLQNFS